MFKMHTHLNLFRSETQQFLHASKITHGMNTTASPSLILAPGNTIGSQTLLLSGVVLVLFLLNALRNYTTHL